MAEPAKPIIAQPIKQSTKLTTASSTENTIAMKIWFTMDPPFHRVRTIPQTAPQIMLPKILTVANTFKLFSEMKVDPAKSKVPMAGMHNTSQKKNRLNFNLLPQNGQTRAGLISGISFWQCGQFMDFLF
jgi:hypothetical protein